MLTIFGNREKYCDGHTRRNFLKFGALATGGLSLPQLLQAEAKAGTSAPRRKSIINIYLGGGPSHMDTFDLKPDAPAEYRGEFRPIATNVPGMEICQHFEKLAHHGDKLAIIRSVAGVRNEHSATQTDSGWNDLSLRSQGGRPGLGAVISKLQGTVNGDAPTSIGLSGFSKPGFLGPVYKDFEPTGQGRGDLTLDRAMTIDRLGDRRSLLSSLDRIKSDVDRSGMMDAVDEFTERAMTVITSGTLADAMNLENEDPRTIDRYGINDSTNVRRGDNQRLLLARRAVEAGVRVVSLRWGGWDTHSNNFKSLSQQVPALDVGLSALLEDLDARGMLEDTMVMVSGEFGRTPRVNANAGRDHWPSAAFWVLAGGGLKTGKVIGSTNERGEHPQDNPVHLQQIYCSIYYNMGIDPATTTLIDPNGRPQYLVDHREPLKELI